MPWFKAVISQKKTMLSQLASAPMEALSGQCSACWTEPAALDRLLQQGIQDLPHCNLIYAVDTAGTLISSSIGPHQLDSSLQNRSLSGRPFLTHTLPFQGLTLSQVYVSQFNQQPCITAMQVVRQDDRVLGFIAADFAVEDLPQQQMSEPLPSWVQYRGDPSIRSTLFLQSRTDSVMDQHIDEVLRIIADMMQHRGIFHVKIHFSSSRISVWSVDDPYCYRIHTLEEIIDPDRMLVYAERAYTERAQVPQDAIGIVLKLFKILRDADETVYLRSASFNLINGMVGLTFSCDGSHYIHYEEFLTTDICFWFGSPSATKRIQQEPLQ